MFWCFGVLAFWRWAFGVVLLAFRGFGVGLLASCVSRWAFGVELLALGFWVYTLRRVFAFVISAFGFEALVFWR